MRNFKLIFALSLLVLLAACSSVHKKDGPPPFPVDETKIPNAVPKLEPLSRIGNPNVYTVFGRRYYTLKSANHFEERGIASWYGTQFHRHSTSSGEPYNMLAMTAAHRTLPIPTYVQVTNLKNGRQVIVKVNDRGPFAANRIIDLSYVAAKKLGMIGHGTAYVDIKAINPVEYARSHRNYSGTHHSVYAENRKSSHVYLQVGAFSQRSNAEKLRTRLTSVVTSPIKISLENFHHKYLYRVAIGPIKDAATVTSLTRRLKSLGIASKKVNGEIV